MTAGDPDCPAARTPGSVLALIGIGLAAGFFSGLFGIGGGLIIVPGLVVLLRIDQRRAVGTSLLAIVPAIAASLTTYLLAGSVDLLVGALLALGAVFGAQLGSWLLPRLPLRVVQWAFLAFVAVVVVQLVLVVPDRNAEVTLDAYRVAALVAVGLVAGVLSAILGIGGGGVVVPILIAWFGASDLDAKGASLVMMVPTVLSGLVANLARRNVDVRAGLTVGAASLLSSPLGAWVAHLVTSQVGAWLFAAFLVFIGATMLREAVR